MGADVMQELPPGFELETPTPPPTRAPGVLRGPQETVSPVERQRLNNDSTRLGIQLREEQREIEDRRIDEQEQARLAQAQADGIEDSIFQLRNVIDAAKQARARSNDWFATGFGAETAANIGGTSAADVEALLNTIGANTAFDRLQAMRDASPTGGALGQVSEIELRLLRDSTASIAQSQSDEQFQANMLKIEEAYQRVLDRLEGRIPRATSDEMAQASQLSPEDREQFFSSRNIQPPDPTPTARDQAPLGYEIGFDQMGRDEPFDRDAALGEFGFTPEKETQFIGILNANRGNQNFTAERLAQVYGDLGVAPPTQEQMEEMAQGVRDGLTATGIDTSALERAYIEGLDRDLEAGGDTVSEGQALVSGVARGTTLSMDDEIIGLGGAVASAAQLKNPLAGYKRSRDLARRHTERNREAHPILSYGGEIAGAIVTGGKLAGNPQGAGQAARIGAAEGGAYGFGGGDGLADSAGNAAIGAMGGAAIGGATQPLVRRATDALARRAAAKRIPNAQEVAQAAERQGVTVRAADMNPQLAQRRAEVQQTPQGRPQVAQADADDLAGMESALIRELGGTTARADEAGTTIQGGVTTARNNLRRSAQRDYRAASSQAGNVQVDANRALDVIDEQIAELAERGAERNAAKIEYLRSTRRDISRRGGLSIDGVRAMRTELRNDLNNAGIYTGDFERRMGLVMQGMSEDISTALARNPEAARLYRQADRNWARQARMGERIGDALLGKRGDKGPGAAASQVLNWARNDPARLSRLMSEVSPEVQSEVRALVAGNLGRSANGQFSLAQFLTHTGSGSGAKLNNRAMRSLFGEDGVRAIKDLRTIAEARVNTQAATNRSQTGGVVMGAARGLRRLLLGGFGFTAAGGGGPAGAAGAGGAVVVGEIAERLGTARTLRLVLNPDVSKWLRNAPDTTDPGAINGHFSRLRSIAQRTPGMLADVDALERALIGAVNDNTAGRLAAEEQPNEDN